MRADLVVALFVAASSAAAQASAKLDAHAAQAIIAGCVAHSTAKKQSHAIAVVDSGGHVVAALRMDGNGSGIMDFSVAKAKAAAAWGFSTEQMLQSSRGTPGFSEAPNVVIVPGGIPVFDAEGSRLGAVGVSGEAPPDDAACAEAGIRAAGFRPTRG
jgi:glc operon protein GlcG